MDGEKMLACAVIRMALYDIAEDENKKHKPRKDKKHKPPEPFDKKKLYAFLTGETPMSQFWFEVSGLKPLTGSLEEVLTLARKERNRDGRQTMQVL